MNKLRLDHVVVLRGLAPTRSQAENLIRLGKVLVDGKPMKKPGYFVATTAPVTLKPGEQYVSRAGLKLASVATALNLDFKDKVVLDVGSSTGGFTDFALRRGAQKVIAVDVGTNQLHPSLRTRPQVELHEQTDIRAVRELSTVPNIVVIDVSFISLRDVLPHIATLVSPKTQIVAMVKPQFESGSKQQNNGVIKNDAMRRKILRDFELWAKNLFVVQAKADSEVAGARGNRERFYLLQPAKVRHTV